MAKIYEPISDVELKKITVVNLREEYKKLATIYRSIINNELIYCSHCRQWKVVTAFYASDTNSDGIEHFACKECILNECTDFDKKTGVRTDNKKKSLEIFRRLNWYFNERIYNEQLQSLSEQTGEKIRSTAIQQWIVMLKSLPNWRGKTWIDSEFDLDDENIISESDTKIVKKTLRDAKKRFGTDYNNEELMFLENEYQDWVSRYDCSQKAQEETFQNLSIIKLMKRNAIKKGISTKDLDYSYQQWLDTGNLKPKQNTLDTFSDAQTLGTLIQKYEETRPLPEIDPELVDVDRIGLYIDAFYRGHASKMLGIKNRFSNIYERVMSKYTVKPPSYDEESDSEVLFDKIFGSMEDE